MGHSSTSEIPLQTIVEGPGWSDGWTRMGESEAAVESPGITVTTSIHQIADQKDKKGDTDSCLVAVWPCDQSRVFQNQKDPSKEGVKVINWILQ